MNAIFLLCQGDKLFSDGPKRLSLSKGSANTTMLDESAGLVGKQRTTMTVFALESYCFTTMSHQFVYF
jgi:hypothetical protein